MVIVRDSREQTGWDFSEFPVTVETGTLYSGDYSLKGFQDQVVIERKELSDAIGCLTQCRERFYHELQRLNSFQSVALVIEAPLQTIRSGEYRSKVNPDSVEQSLISIMQSFRMPVYFADSRKDAERFTYHFLRHFLRHAEARYKAVAVNTDTTVNATFKNTQTSIRERRKKICRQ